MKHLLFVLALLFVTPAWSQAIVVATCGSGAYPVGQLHQLTMNPAGDHLCGLDGATTTMAGTEVTPGASGAPDEKRPPTALPEPKK